ncbi:MAG: hypothetical protein COB94_004285 [Gammaproteobacteria bacterium]|nr:hypothetical protein [Gammaproteobacteria bacterium]
MILAQPKTRYSAFAVHLLISIILFIFLAAIIRFIWYPGFLFQTDGGWQGIRLIAGVDFVLGPVLTLFVYKVGKPSLKLDLSVIAAIQIAALTYGSWLVHQERPLAIVFTDGVIRTVSASIFNDEIAHEVLEKIQKIGQLPAWVYVKTPDIDAKEGGRLLDVSKNGLPHTRFHLYESFFDKKAEIKRNALTIEKQPKYKKVIEQAGENPIYVLKARFAYGLIELDAEELTEVNLHSMTFALQDI